MQLLLHFTLIYLFTLTLYLLSPQQKSPHPLIPIYRPFQPMFTHMIQPKFLLISNPPQPQTLSHICLPNLKPIYNEAHTPLHRQPIISLQSRPPNKLFPSTSNTAHHISFTTQLNHLFTDSTPNISSHTPTPTPPCPNISHVTSQLADSPDQPALIPSSSDNVV